VGIGLWDRGWGEFNYRIPEFSFVVEFQQRETRSRGREIVKKREWVRKEDKKERRSERRTKEGSK
jgi:hypothetical protein